jgi:diguanylate cyclase (GGDEF)-like protein/PAS domain S-box-containing protein
MRRDEAMKRSLFNTFTILLALCLSLIGAEANAQTLDNIADLSGVFSQHGSVMLLIDPVTGDIVDANNAAADYYGYSKDQLTALRISSINMLTPQEIATEMQAAATEQRNYFVFKHQLANGTVRNVEVFSYPVMVDSRRLLFSLVHDITDKALLQQEISNRNRIGFVIAGISLTLLSALLALVIRSRRHLRIANRDIAYTNAMLRTFIDAQGDLVYLKDAKLRYVFVNKAFEAFFGKTADQVIGLDDYALTEHDFADLRRKTDMDVLDRGVLLQDETHWGGKIFSTTKFPVTLPDAQTGIGAYIRDITAQRMDEKKREKTTKRLSILSDILTRSFPDKQEQLDYVLHEALKLTESIYGYIYLYDDQRQEFTLNTWTKGVMESCNVLNPQTQYSLENTGIWGEVVRQHKTIMLNDFQRPHALKKGYPDGHVALERFLSTPVVVDGHIVAVVGLANKPYDYDDTDVLELSLLMNGAWNTLQRHEIQEKLAFERSRYLQTLVSIGDGVLVVNREGNVEMMNQIAQTLTGWKLDEASGRHYSQVFVIQHEQRSVQIADPIADALRTGKTQALSNHAILVSKHGQTYNLEDSAAPIQSDAGETTGVVLVFRDVTEKMRQLKQIEYLSFRDPLTGLFNRRYASDAMEKMDIPDNLPLTVVMGDVNGLKLTNDVFGHAYGDQLLQCVGDVFRRCGRQNDLIARWGGDEFVLVLPATRNDEAQKLITQIKAEFAREEIGSIKGSISLGFACKEQMETDIATLLRQAEEVMYQAKTLERDSFRKSAIDDIVTALHNNSMREREHAEAVREIAQAIGRVMQLSDVDVRNLSDAAYLHDIGKIVLDPLLLNINHHLTEYEWNEIKRHPIVGYRILNAFDDTLHLAESVLAHQERWDGHGYPRGLKGNQIPLLARIIAVAESYERMRHDSANTPALSKEQARQNLLDNAGSQFDPEIVKVFVEMLDQDIPGRL